MSPLLQLGRRRALDGSPPSSSFALPTSHLVTHGVIVGMTGSGKTGLVTVLVEEALRAEVPVIVLDVKGDLPNLRLVPALEPEEVGPWIEPLAHETEREHAARVQRSSDERREALAAWSIGEGELDDYRARTHVRLITPGSEAGELLHVLSALERRSPRWDTDVEGARAALAAASSLLLRLIGRDADPARSKDHVFLSLLAEQRLLAGRDADLASLVPEILEPPMRTVGALEVDAFLSARSRKDLAASLNGLLASPTFASWRMGATLDVASWVAPVDGKTPATIVSVAHLDDDERELVLGMVLEEILTWVRGLSGTQSLRALVVFDEVYGFLPPHPASPPTKRPIVALMKQARAFGVGVVLATQNPMDLDYRALSNAGLWCLGRLQTDADRERVIDGLAGAAGSKQSAEELSRVLKRLSSRWFVVRDAHDGESCMLMQPRWAMSLLRGPMTRGEIRRAVAS
ncbi:MAG: helicase HerA-like domain-containing protein [Sandaracinus sp.]